LAEPRRIAGWFGLLLYGLGAQFIQALVWWLPAADRPRSDAIVSFYCNFVTNTSLIILQSSLAFSAIRLTFAFLNSTFLIAIWYFTYS
jgi:hypothetical protein